MNTHKIEINFKINEILAVDSNSDIIEIKNLKQLEIILKQNIKMKNKLLKIRNEMSKNDQDIGFSKILKKTEKKKGQGSRKQNNKIKTNSNSSNKLCKLNESDHHRRLITYDDLDASFYTLDQESMYLLNNNKLCKQNNYEIEQNKSKLENLKKHINNKKSNKKNHQIHPEVQISLKTLNDTKERLNNLEEGFEINLTTLIGEEIDKQLGSFMQEMRKEQQEMYNILRQSNEERYRYMEMLKSEFG